MALPGQLKTKIDLLKKKLETGGDALPAARRRQLSKRLKRSQRTRRIALAVEKKAAARVKGATAGEAPASPSA